MSRLFEVDPSRPDQATEAIHAAADAVQAGRLVVFPTDTVYGLACRPDDAAATGRLFDAKRRPSGLTLPVLAPSTELAFDLGVSNGTAVRLAEQFWPGPLTMILPRSRGSNDWWLGETTASIGVRVPDHPVALALLERTGPVAATSANLSGQEPIKEAHALREAFGDDVAIYLVTPPATSGWGRSSTVVDLTGRDVAILREGPSDPADLLSAAGRVGGMAS